MLKKYSLRELTREITGQDYDNILVDTLDSDYRKITRYYNSYKEIEHYVDYSYCLKKEIDSTNKDMIVDILSKIYNNPEYGTFLTKASKLSYEEFIRLISENEKEESIYLDIFFGSMHKLDYDYYSLDDGKVDEYIDNLYSLEVNKEYIYVRELSEDLIHGINTIKSRGMRILLLELMRQSFSNAERNIILAIYMERYLDRIRSLLPEYKYIISMDQLPEDLQLEYYKYNSDGMHIDEDGIEVYHMKKDERGLPEENITDEMIVNIVKEHKERLDKEAKRAVDQENSP